MKKVKIFGCYSLLTVGIFLLFANQSMADTFCVANEANLIAALDAAKDNSADDVIKIQQGTYYGNFVYESTEFFDLTLEGGYAALCASSLNAVLARSEFHLTKITSPVYPATS